VRLVDDRARGRGPEEAREQTDRDDGSQAPLAAGCAKAEEQANTLRAVFAEREGGEDGHGAECEQEAGRSEQRQVHQ
jgi:hypothetical protein